MDHKKIFLYIIGGFCATLIDMGLLYVFTEYLSLYYLMSQIFSFFISFVFGFLFQKYITFDDKEGNYRAQGLLFLGFQLIGLGINLGILYMVVSRWGRYYMIGSLASKGIVFVRNFTMNHFYNFKK